MNKRILLVCISFLFLLIARRSSAQCDTGSAPSFSSGCTSEYYTSITASGTGVLSTVSYTGSSCLASYFDESTFGVTAPTGTVVNLNIVRCSTTYTAHLSVYIDWNQDGLYESSELVGTPFTMTSGVTSYTYTFTIPLTGIVTNTNLEMRIFMTEGSGTGAPCSGTYGEAVDYYLNASCTTPLVAISPSAPSVCGGGGTTMTASGVSGTPTYVWYPATGLSSGTGAIVTASPAATTTYTVTGYGPGQCIDTDMATVTLFPAIAVTVTPTGPVTFCPGGSVLLNTIASGTGYIYQWYNGATAITGAILSSYTATAAGDYYVNVTAPVTGCTDTSGHITVAINPAPAPVVTASGPLVFCTSVSVTLTEISGTGTSYQWYNTAGAISGATNAAYVATASGRDSVVVTNSYGCSTPAPASVVTVNATPAAVLTPAGPLVFCSGSSAVLSVTTGAGYSYQWYNNGTAIVSAVTSSHIVNTAGGYSVIVTGAGGCADTTNTVIVSLHPSPSPVVAASAPVSFCTPGSVTLTETSGTGILYQWYNNAGAIPGATNTFYTTTASGRDSVVVTNSYGCSTASPATIVTANLTPVASVLPGGPVYICAGSTATLVADAGPSYTYQWYNASGAIPGATAISHTTGAAGSYYVIITGAGGCTAISNTVVVTVNPLPDVTTIASGPLSFCPGYNVTFTAASGYTYQWYNTSVIPGATEVSYTASGADAYYVSVTNSFGCTANSATFNTFVYPAPATTVSYSGPLSFCTGGSLTISAEALAGDTYQWYNNTGALAGETFSSLTTSVSGDDYAVITSGNGCVSATVSSHVVEVAPPFISAAGDTTFCQGGSVLLITSTSGASGITYQWMKDGINITGATGEAYGAVISGSYSCLVIISSSCFSTTNAVSIVVHPTPDPVVSYDGTHLSTSPYYTTYQWYLNTVQLPGDTLYQMIPTQIGSYRVQVSDTNSCPAYSSGFNILALGVNNVAGASAISIYPNPATEVLHIVASVNVHAVISSIAGKMVLDEQNAKDIDIALLPPGIYIATLYSHNGEKLLIEKFVKK